MKLVNSVFLLLLLLVGGCAGAGVDYTKVEMNAGLNAKPEQRIAVEVRDQRPYVMNGNQQPDFVGNFQGKYGSSEFKTDSGKPLAEDLSVLITSALGEQGLRAAPVNEIGKYDILLRFTLRDWRIGNAAGGLGYFYDVGLTVLDGGGKVLSQRNVSESCAYDLERLIELGLAGRAPQSRTSANVLEALLSDTETGSICEELMKPIPASRIAGPPPPGRARVVFIRPPQQTGRPQMWTAPILEIGSEKVDMVGFLSVGRKVSFLAEPGEKLFMIVGENEDLLQAYLAEGKTYYVVVSNHMGWTGTNDRFFLEPVNGVRARSIEFRDWRRSTTLVENTELSRRWVEDNRDSIAGKKADALKKWSQMSGEEKKEHTLWTQDGQ